MLGQGDEKLTGRQIVVLLESYAVMSLEYPRLLENYIKPAISVLSNKRMGSQENVRMSQACYEFEVAVIKYLCCFCSKRSLL
jgi:hypothetical protein